MGDIKALKDVVEKNISENNYIDIEAIDEYVSSLGIDYNLIKPLIEKIYLSNLSLTNKEKNLKNKIDDYYKNIKINPLNEKDSQTTYNENPKPNISKTNIKLSKSIEEIKKMNKTDLELFLKRINNDEIYNILIALYKDLTLIHNMKKESNETDFDEEYNYILELINYIKSIQNAKTIVHTKESKKINKVIYLKSLSGNYIIEKDFKDIPQDFYPSFEHLIKSIENNTFINKKRIGKSDNKKLTNIMEVKLYQSRVLYIQLSQDIYMILTCFIKKSDNSKDYANYLKHISDIFEMQKNDILKNIQDDSFMKEETNFHKLLKSFIGGEDYGKIKKIFR